MDRCIYTISVCDIAKTYDISTRSVHRWLDGNDVHVPRYHQHDGMRFAIADLVPAIPRDPDLIITLDHQRCPKTRADIDLGSDVTERAARLWRVLSPIQQEKLAAIRGTFREERVRAFWSDVVHLDATYLADALSLHPTVIRAIFGDDTEPPEIDRQFCVEFTLKNTPTKSLWQIAQAKPSLLERIHNAY